MKGSMKEIAREKKIGTSQATRKVWKKAARKKQRQNGRNEIKSGLSTTKKIRQSCRVQPKEKKMEKILNLTQHTGSDSQKKAGVVDLPEEEREILQGLLTFTATPTKEQLAKTARAIAVLAEKQNATACMIGGAGFLMGHLERALQVAGIQVKHAFSKRRSVEENGIKKSIFVHEGFVDV